jgi:predicted phage-related endonuclease
VESTTPGSDLWHERRRTGIGGSDAAAILHLNKYRSPLMVYLEKVGQAPPDEAGEPASWGNRLEPVILGEYAKRSGLWVVGRREEKLRVWSPEGAENGIIAEPDVEQFMDLLRHPIRSYMIGNIDGLAYRTPDLTDVDRFVEVKTSSAYRSGEWGKENTDQIPTEYRVQVAHYQSILAALGHDRPFEVAVLIGGNTMRLYACHRDVSLERAIENRLEKFWNDHVCDRVPPEPTSLDLGVLAHLYPSAEQEVVEVDENFQDYVETYLRAKNAKARAELQMKDAEAHIKGMLGFAARAEHRNWRVTWTDVSARKATDWKGVAATLADQMEGGRDALATAVLHHTTTTPQKRRFQVKETGEGGNDG